MWNKNPKEDKSAKKPSFILGLISAEFFFSYFNLAGSQSFEVTKELCEGVIGLPGDCSDHESEIKTWKSF